MLLPNDKQILAVKRKHGKINQFVVDLSRALMTSPWELFINSL